jgi:hypothetical protein
MVGLYPLIGLPAAIGVYAYATRASNRTLRVVALGLATLFLVVLVLRLVAPG